MPDSFSLLIPGYRPMHARLVSPGEVEIWEVTGPSIESVNAQKVADRLVTIMGARGRSMKDVALLHQKGPGRSLVMVHLQPRPLTTSEVV